MRYRYQRIIICVSFIFITCLNAFCQKRTVLVFDLQEKMLDSILIDVSSIDKSKEHDHTPFYIGDFNANIESLEEETPTENLNHPDSKSTKRKKAHLDYDLNSFPIRTSVKISYIKDNEINNLCSGSFISRRHILTAAHCTTKYKLDSLLFDTLLVCPVFDNGMSNPNFGCNFISKIFLFKNWNKEEDFAILELMENIGQQTGWLGIGYENRESSLIQDHLFYKFIYPARYIPEIDSTHFNGDTLYYKYGRIHAFKFSFGDSVVYKYNFYKNFGINGESGSSLISIINNELYVSFGVLSGFYSMITNEIFHVIKTIIKNDVITTTIDKNLEPKYKIFPNPTSNIIYIDNLNSQTDISITTTNGQMLKHFKNIENQLNISDLPAGMYIMYIKNKEISERHKIVKVE